MRLTRSLRQLVPFDKHKFVTRLDGFTPEQQQAALQVVSDVLEQRSISLEQDLVPSHSETKTRACHQVDFQQLKSELQALERGDFAALKAENDRLSSEIDKVNQKMREDLARLFSSTRLDLNLERGKIFDDHSEILQKLSETDTKQLHDLAQIKSSLGNVQFDTLRTLLTTASTLGLVLLGYLRLFK